MSRIFRKQVAKLKKEKLFCLRRQIINLQMGMRFQFIKREKQRNLLLNLSKINVVIMLGDRFCSNCFVVKTPLWRRDPKSGGHLCNACGLYQRNNSGSARPLERPKNTRVVSKLWQICIQNWNEYFFFSQTSSKHKGKKCYNCQAEKTTLWRQITNEKITVCNACGLYYNLHNVRSPFNAQ